MTATRSQSEKPAATRYVPAHIKRALIREAGEKCANPGCATSTVEFHHIDEWSVVQVHDPDVMIAICPTCHAAVHGGTLRITRATLLGWKQVRRTAGSRRAHLYVEPSDSHIVVVGSITVTAQSSPIRILSPSSQSALAYSLVNGDTLCLNARLTFENLPPLVVELGHIATPDCPDFELDQRPGHVRVYLNQPPRSILPTSVYRSIVANEPWFFERERLLVFEALVEAPGQVRVGGVWHDANGDVVVVTRHAAHYYAISTDVCLGVRGSRGLMGSRASCIRFENFGGEGAVFDFLRVCANSISGP
jgi:hypothetical protein